MKFGFTLEEKAKMEEKNYEPIPEGKYVVRIESIDEKATRNGGSMLVLKERVLFGEYRNRVLFQNVNIVNASEAAVRIGRETMMKIYLSAEVDLEADSAKLIGKAIGVNVIQEEFNGSIKNVVKSVVSPSLTKKDIITEEKEEPLNDDDVKF